MTMRAFNKLHFLMAPTDANLNSNEMDSTQENEQMEAS